MKPLKKPLRSKLQKKKQRKRQNIKRLLKKLLKNWNSKKKKLKNLLKEQQRKPPTIQQIKKRNWQTNKKPKKILRKMDSRKLQSVIEMEMVMMKCVITILELIQKSDFLWTMKKERMTLKIDQCLALLCTIKEIDLMKFLNHKIMINQKISQKAEIQNQLNKLSKSRTSLWQMRPIRSINLKMRLKKTTKRNQRRKPKLKKKRMSLKSIQLNNLEKLSSRIQQMRMMDGEIRTGKLSINSLKKLKTIEMPKETDKTKKQI